MNSTSESIPNSTPGYSADTLPFDYRSVSLPSSWIGGNYIKPELRKTFNIKFEPTIELFNIAFHIRRSGEHIIVESPQWDSLRTHGKTTREAIDSMLGLIRDVIEEYVFIPESELTLDAIEFRNFLIRRLFT